MSNGNDGIKWAWEALSKMPESMRLGEPVAVRAALPMSFGLGPEGELTIDWPQATIRLRLVVPAEGLESLKNAVEIAQSKQGTRLASRAKPRMH